MRALALGVALFAIGCGNEIQFPGDGGAGGTSASGPSGSQSTGSQGGISGSPSSGSTSTGSEGSSTSTSGSGMGGASPTSVAASSVGSGMATSTSSTGSGGSCKSCSDALLGNMGPFCPGSDVLFEDLVQCACADFCAVECEQACTGMPAPGNCDACIEMRCTAALDTCLGDI